jgi:predicted phosphodiesterase
MHRDYPAQGWTTVGCVKVAPLLIRNAIDYEYFDMNILVYSDLHLEFGPFDPPATNADVVVLAGDIASDCKGLQWARRVFGNLPIVYVLGNHEFYGEETEELTQSARSVAKKFDIHLLECDSAVIGGVRFLGTTLWTDFEVDSGITPDEAMRYADQGMSDFRVIRYRSDRLSANDTRKFHIAARAWLQSQLAIPHLGKTVVVTHHLPHTNSIDKQYSNHPLNAAFVSHMPQLVRAPVDLWIHGHTHSSCDYTVAGTRVVCNPRGYYPYELNQDFDPKLLINVLR